ncbi:unnamed protein product [Musa acuminata var. zebrina]
MEEDERCPLWRARSPTASCLGTKTRALCNNYLTEVSATYTDQPQGRQEKRERKEGGETSEAPKHMRESTTFKILRRRREASKEGGGSPRPPPSSSSSSSADLWIWKASSSKRRAI